MSVESSIKNLADNFEKTSWALITFGILTQRKMIFILLYTRQFCDCFFLGFFELFLI